MAGGLDKFCAAPGSGGGGGGAADSALDFLADLAAMKSGAKSTAFDGPIQQPKKRKGKKKRKTKESSKSGKKGKKGKKRVEVIEDIAEEDEKTPEPPSNLTEIEKRKFKLKYARRKLERRKREREKVRAAKALKLNNNNNNNNMETNTYGKSYIDKFMKQLETEQTLIKKKIIDAIKLEEEENKKKKAENDLLSGLGLSREGYNKSLDSFNKSLDRSPGRINNLSISDILINHKYIISKKIETRNVMCQTQSKIFEDYLREEFIDDFNDNNGNPINMNIKIIAGLVESTLKFGYPRELWELESNNNMSSSPSPTAIKIRGKQQAQDERKRKIKEEQLRRKIEREVEKERRKNTPYMNRN
eukprot:855307_1